MIEDKIEEDYQVNDKKSVLEDVHIGDFVRLLVDGVFFGSEHTYERYGGFVASIDNYMIGLSASHPENIYHGYNPMIDQREGMRIVEMDVSKIKKYKIFCRNVDTSSG